MKIMKWVLAAAGGAGAGAIYHQTIGHCSTCVGGQSPLVPALIGAVAGIALIGFSKP